MYRTLTIIGFILLTVIPFTSADAEAQWQEIIDQILIDTSDADIDMHMELLKKHNPSWTDIADYLQKTTPPVPEATDILVEKQILCEDGVERPYVLYIPKNYDASKATPLMVILHGGVGRSELIKDRIAYAEEYQIMKIAREAGWIALFPFGQAGALWWDGVGMTNILNQIRTVKTNYNIDDNRVWMGGFSDGASASFFFAMAKPNDFGAFVPLNGHMGVAALDGELTTCPANMRNSPQHVICTDNDGLYPAARMRKTIEMAIDAGADIIYREYNGYGHDFGYAEAELPVIANFLDSHPRDRFPNKVFCESVGPDFGWMRWLRLESIAPGTRAEWHKDYNTPLVDNRITFGFFIDSEFEGSGLKVDKLVDGATLSAEMGLTADDIIIECQGQKISNNDDLDKVKESLNRGDTVTIQVKRGDEKVTLKGKLPPPLHYLLMPIRQPTGALKANYMANTFKVKSSQVAEFTVFIHPDMIQLDQPVRIIVDGVETFNAHVKPDIDFMIRNYLEHRDRALLYVNYITVKLAS